MNQLRRHAVTVVIALGMLFSISVHAEILTGKIVGISDGDTVTLLDANKRQYKIRLTGIDAPEKKMPFGQRSKEHLSDLVFSKDVQVETEKLDRYGRTLGKILFDRKDINLAMIKAGLAWHYKKYQKDQSRSDRLLYAHAEDQARQQRIGLWRDSNPTPPWDWRKAGRTNHVLAAAVAAGTVLNQVPDWDDLSQFLVNPTATIIGPTLDWGNNISAPGSKSRRRPQPSDSRSHIFVEA